VDCEIEFLPVGDGSKAGDAILVRYGSAQNNELMVIDGGNLDSGKMLVEHLRTQFGKSAVIKHALVTHSDADHASGMREVLRELTVTNLWLHIPWLLAEEARPLFKDKGFTEEGLRKAIKKEYDIISEIVDLGCAAKCKFYYPFAGNSIGPFRILSPSRYVYRYLLPQFDKTPKPDQEAIEAASMWLGKQSPLTKFLEAVVAKAQKWVSEGWDSELLKDGGITSASNETSVVMFGDFGEKRRVLLTGDAGVEALTWAANYADQLRLPLQDFMFVQIPHHGSRRNVGPTILNRLLGYKQAEGSPSRFAAYVSAPKEDDTHPRKMVLNAFMRRGGRVIATQGSNKVYLGGFPKRDGYVSVEPLPFATQVEDYDA
jgi:beta-lactamase superfamily II metal-dependent hydrolase